ncbi:MAG TPA: hypothetical protein VL652_34790 [Kutzneria sp.]|jgi:site-specific recombinase XerD|nr:hypothetical protein [Kutzneria sp.]
MIPAPEQIIEAHLREMTAGGYAVNTIEDARRVLLAAQSELPAGLPTAATDELVDWLARDGWSVQTRATYRQHLRRFFLWATANQWISWDPSSTLRRPRVPIGLPHPATDQEVHLATTRADLPHRLSCRLAAYAGLRCCEIAALRREDITAETMRVLGKGGKEAVVPTHPRIWELVTEVPPGPLICWRGGPVVAHWVTQRTTYHLRTKLDVWATMHEFRHWFGTMIQRTYHDSRVTQQLMRHASLTSTQVYTLITDDQARRAVLGLPDVSGR